MLPIALTGWFYVKLLCWSTSSVTLEPTLSGSYSTGCRGLHFKTDTSNLSQCLFFSECTNVPTVKKDSIRLFYNLQRLINVFLYVIQLVRNTRK